MCRADAAASEMPFCQYIAKGWLSKYPFVSNEDPFDPIDSEAYVMFRVPMGRSQQIVSDDLLMKMDQTGSITGAIETAVM